MPPQIGYLLPTRERVMEGRPETAPLLELAARAEGLGFDSVWVGDSLLARPRHDPLTLLAAVALSRSWRGTSNGTIAAQAGEVRAPPNTRADLVPLCSKGSRLMFSSNVKWKGIKGKSQPVAPGCEP